MSKLTNWRGAITAYRQKIITEWLDYWRSIVNRRYIYVGLAFNILLWLIAGLIAFRAEKKLLVIHYNIWFGIDWVGGLSSVFWLPAIGLFSYLLNLLLSWRLARIMEPVKYILLSAAILVNVILLMAIYAVWSVNYIKLFN